MNKIVVNNNKIKIDDSNILFNDNEIIFNESGNYLIEYVNSSDIKLEFVIKNVNVNLLEYSFDEKITVENKYTVDHGSLRVDKFYNNERVKEKITIDLCSYNDKVDYYFSNICRCEEYYTMDINHKNKNTFSNISNKSIALKNSKLDFIINSNVGKKCNGSVLDQNTRIVTMGECDTRISPNMFIDLEDVTARHGSVVGTFKEDQLFYLMSKGISYYDSLKLLIKGYLLANINVNLELRQKILNIIDVYWR